MILSASGLKGFTLTVSTCSCMTVTLTASLCSVLHAMNSNLKEMYREQIPTYTGMSGDRAVQARSSANTTTRILITSESKRPYAALF